MGTDILVYTFRNFPWQTELRAIDSNLFIFGKLKQDLAEFEKQLIQRKPDWIIGIAKSTRGPSFWDQEAVNKFNTGKINHDGVEQYQLFVPESDFRTRPQTRTTFCNWTSYLISQLVNDHQLNTKVSFIHIAKQDLKTLTTLLSAATLPGMMN